MPLRGGQLNQDIARIGDTVHRAQGDNAEFVHKLLIYLESAAVAFAESPRFLGTDEKGREVLSYFEGQVIPGNGPKVNDSQLKNVSKLIKHYHDTTVGSGLTGESEIVMHGDLGPHNTVFQGNTPMGLIDWDDARPGTRLRDFAYAVDCFIDLANDRYSASEQVRRLNIMCTAYDWDNAAAILEDIRLDYHNALSSHKQKRNTASIKIFEDLASFIDKRTAKMQRLLEL